MRLEAPSSDVKSATDKELMVEEEDGEAQDLINNSNKIVVFFFTCSICNLCFYKNGESQEISERSSRVN